MKGNVNIVLDHTDEPSLSIELSRRADPPAGVVVVRPIPGVTTRTELAADLLIALGKRFDALERERKRPQAWQLAQQWLQAEQTRHVVIIDADRLQAKNLWADLAALTCHVPATNMAGRCGAPNTGPVRRRPTAPPQVATKLRLSSPQNSSPPTPSPQPTTARPLAAHDGIHHTRMACHHRPPKTAHPRTPLPVLIRIAQLVDFPVANLFWSAPTAHDDASTVGACLGDNPQGLSRDNLARALLWDFDRVEMALRHLDARIAARASRRR